MLTLWEAIQRRRSIRSYAADDVPDELVMQMIEAARLAPSGGNSQPWRFIVVRDREVKRELRRICANQKLIEQASVVIVCFADVNHHPPGSGRSGSVANCYIAVEHLVLMATALGVGTCWVANFSDAPAANRLFTLGDNMVLAAVIPVGYPAGEVPPQRSRLSLEEIILRSQVQLPDEKR